MTLITLLRRSLWHHRRAQVAVLLGVVVGTAVLTGSLLLGDSLRGSLRDLTLRRLGHIDVALAGSRFFPESLAERFQAAATDCERVAPIILLQGSVLHRNAEGAIQARAGNVQIVGVDERFWPLFESQADDLSTEVVLNAPVADELGIGVGDRVELRFDRPQAVPAESVIGRRNEPEGLVLEESKVRAILPTESSERFVPGRFSLFVQQRQPRLAFVQLRRLQNRLARDADQRPSSANVLLIQTKPPLRSQAELATLQTALNEVATLEDLELELRADASGNRYLSLESRRMIFEPEVVTAVVREATQRGWTSVPTFTYLANLISRDPGYVAAITSLSGEAGAAFTPLSPLLQSRQLTGYTPYSAVAALNPAAAAPFGPFVEVDGQPVRTLAEDEILLNSFVAADLWPLGNWRDELGKPVVRIGYFVEGADHQLEERTAVLRLAGVVPVEGMMADRSLTPEFPGLRGTRVADWNPPFPRSQWHPEWIRETDEAYYRQHRVAPKAFVSPELAAKLWSSRWGDTTSIRLTQAGTPLAEFASEVRGALRTALSPETVGMRLQPVKLLGLAATSSGTALMFGWLFVGFSLFIIVAAALLVALLFRLGAEQRGKEWGLLFAVGFPVRTLRRLMLGEGLAVAALGSLLGLGAAVGFTALVLAWLRRSWADTLSSSFLELHLQRFDPAFGPLPFPSFVLGFFISLAIAAGAITASVRGFAALAPMQLLGGPAGGAAIRPVRRPWLTIAALVSALGLALASVGLPQQEAAGLFFGSGFLALLGGLGLVRQWLLRNESRPISGHGFAGLIRLGRSYASRSPGRSLLTIGLLAAGTFMVLAVQAFRQTTPDDNRKDSGTGGFALVGQADVPLPQPPATPEIWLRLAAAGRDPDEVPPAFPKGTEVYGLRLRGGDDVSCLNLYEPQDPRILGVPRSFAGRGGFRFQLPADVTAEETAQPWLLLERSAEEAIPILADDHAAQWVLQRKIGDVWNLQDEQGRPVAVRLVGMLTSSLFQGELLMSEDNFRQVFPASAGYRYFLIDAPQAERQTVKRAFDSAFGETFGLNLEGASEKLASYQAVENTYISTFQALGGLGLLLGSTGLGVVLLRNFNERRGEWALLRALGYTRAALAFLALVENALLVAAGLFVGISAAALALAPNLRSGLGELPWLGIFALLTLIPLIGLCVGLFALRVALQTPLLPALQRE